MGPFLAALHASIDQLFAQLDAGAVTHEHARLQLDLLRHTHAATPGRAFAMRAAAAELNARAAVNKLPPELLYVIFRHLDVNALRLAPLRVCAHWRRAALSDVQLWTRIHVRSWHALDAVPVLLARSGIAPVDVRLELDRTPVGRAAPPDVSRCAAALADHMDHIDALAITVFSPAAFRDVAGTALDRKSASLRKFSVRILSGSPAVLRLQGFTALRHLATTVRPEAGSWLSSLGSLQLDYPVTLDNLLDVLMHASSLQSLRLKCGVLGKPPLRRKSIDPRVRRLRLQEFILEHASEEWALLFEGILPLAYVQRAAITPVHHFTQDGPFLFKGIGPITAIALNASGTRLVIAFADMEGHRRLLSISDCLDRTMDVVALDHPLSDIKSVTILATIDWQFMHWHLHNIPLDGLRTFIFELPYRLLNGVLSLDDSVQLFQTLRLHTPALESIVLTVKRLSHLPDDAVAVIDPVLAVAYIERLVPNPARLPVLRLVNLRLASGDPLDHLRHYVSGVVETVWDSAASRRWIGMPEYAFNGW
ncbi:hypothetical protein AURDEDRAFT_156525 [Auricularia subglabra TFB-10046 SS5]|nr:hypothetical protein AURDEDRAFT_156525 [Auricularia subglabra TFB-10046 SS5]